MSIYSNLPLVAMKDNIFLPNTKARLEVSREFSKNAIKLALENGGKLFMVGQTDPSTEEITQNGLHLVGVVGEIASVDSATSEAMSVTVHTLQEAKIVRYTDALFQILCPDWTLSENKPTPA